MRNLGTYAPRRAHKLNQPLLTMLLNGVHDHHAGRVFVLQIGAGTGQDELNLHRRFVEDGWSGLLIEPHPQSFAALEALHASSDRIAILNLGISDSSANLVLHSVADSIEIRLRRNRASLNRDRLLGPGIATKDIVSAELPFLRLDTVLGELGIDSAQLVVIDAGGHEAQVLDSFVLTDLDLSLVLVESVRATPSDDACIASLLAAGLVPFRLGEWLAGFVPGRLAVPLEELMTFMNKGVAAKEEDE